MVMYLCAATDQMNIAKCEVFDMNTYRHTPLGRDIHTEMHSLDAPAHIFACGFVLILPSPWL